MPMISTDCFAQAALEVECKPTAPEAFGLSLRLDEKNRVYLAGLTEADLLAVVRAIGKALKADHFRKEDACQKQ